MNIAIKFVFKNIMNYIKYNLKFKYYRHPVKNVNKYLI